MRPALRALAASALLLVAAFGTAGPASAASAQAAQPWNYAFAWDYCFDDVVQTYCFDMKGRMHVTSTPDGRELAVITSRQVVSVYRDGAYVGGYAENALDRTVFEDGGQSSMHSVVHTRTWSDGGSCVVTAILRIVDYEVVVDKWLAPVCS